MTIQNLFNSLLRRGYSARLVKMSFGDTAIMIDHDYSGLYPDSSALAIHDAVSKIGAKYGYHTEQRGHWSGTLIRDRDAIAAEEKHFEEINKFWEVRHAV